MYLCVSKRWDWKAKGSKGAVLATRPKEAAIPELLERLNNVAEKLMGFVVIIRNI